MSEPATGPAPAKSKGSRWVEWVAAGLGAGYLPIAPGTWGSAEAVVLVGLIEVTAPGQSKLLLILLLVATFFSGVYLATRVAAAAHDPDPSKVVIDEIAGQILTLLWVPISLFSLVLGFFLFRLFDIVKPFPVRQSEKLPRGWGIMADDMLAGVYAGAVLLLIELWRT